MLKTRITDLFGIEHPVIQGGMQWVGYAELVSAVSNAGALGILTALTQPTPEDLAKEIERTREMTDKPFGVNLPLLFLRDESMVEFCVQHGVKFVTTSAGDPSKYIGVLKDAGITVYHAVPNVAGAMKAVAAGVDGLVVEGTEGGGFKGMEEIGLLVLIQAIRKQSDIPIIAAGGIVDGIGMAAVFAAGAEGIQMGTRFVSSKESPVHDNFKNKIID